MELCLDVSWGEGPGVTCTASIGPGLLTVDELVTLVIRELSPARPVVSWQMRRARDPRPLDPRHFLSDLRFAAREPLSLVLSHRPVPALRVRVMTGGVAGPFQSWDVARPCTVAAALALVARRDPRVSAAHWALRKPHAYRPLAASRDITDASLQHWPHLFCESLEDMHAHGIGQFKHRTAPVTRKLRHAIPSLLADHTVVLALVLLLAVLLLAWAEPAGILTR